MTIIIFLLIMVCTRQYYYIIQKMNLKLLLNPFLFSGIKLICLFNRRLSTQDRANRTTKCRRCSGVKNVCSDTLVSNQRCWWFWSVPESVVSRPQHCLWTTVHFTDHYTCYISPHVRFHRDNFRHHAAY